MQDCRYALVALLRSLLTACGRPTVGYRLTRLVPTALYLRPTQPTFRLPWFLFPAGYALLDLLLWRAAPRFRQSHGTYAPCSLDSGLLPSIAFDYGAALPSYLPAVLTRNAGLTHAGLAWLLVHQRTRQRHALRYAHLLHTTQLLIPVPGCLLPADSVTLLDPDCYGRLHLFYLPLPRLFGSQLGYGAGLTFPCGPIRLPLVTVLPRSPYGSGFPVGYLHGLYHVTLHDVVGFTVVTVAGR